jgi:hypothetical protein
MTSEMFYYIASMTFGFCCGLYFKKLLTAIFVAVLGSVLLGIFMFVILP